MTILVADDSPDDVLLLLRALKRAEPELCVQAVNDGEEVIRYLAGEAAFSDRGIFPFPDLLILDINMRRMGGLDVLKALKTNPAWATIPAAILSGYKDMAGVREAYRLGARTFFTKPLTLLDVGQIVGMAQAGEMLKGLALGSEQTLRRRLD